MISAVWSQPFNFWASTESQESRCEATKLGTRTAGTSTSTHLAAGCSDLRLPDYVANTPPLELAPRSVGQQFDAVAQLALVGLVVRHELLHLAHTLDVLGMWGEANDLDVDGLAHDSDDGAFEPLCRPCGALQAQGHWATGDCDCVLWYCSSEQARAWQMAWSQAPHCVEDQPERLGVSRNSWSTGENRGRDLAGCT